jgi:hypothetical protein
MTEERKLSSLEEMLMRAMGLKDVRELDAMLAAPISQDAEAHREGPDEEYEVYRLLEETYAKADRQWEANQQFGHLFKGKYLN